MLVEGCKKTQKDIFKLKQTNFFGIFLLKKHKTRENTENTFGHSQPHNEPHMTFITTLSLALFCINPQALAKEIASADILCKILRVNIFLIRVYIAHATLRGDKHEFSVLMTKVQQHHHLNCTSMPYMHNNIRKRPTAHALLKLKTHLYTFQTRDNAHFSPCRGEAHQWRIQTYQFVSKTWIRL